jgi:hypothetical protein
VTEELKAPASPACLAHEASDAYMGFATAVEIAAFLARLPAASADDIRRMLPRIRDDALHREIGTRLAEIESSKSRP